MNFFLFVLSLTYFSPVFGFVTSHLVCSAKEMIVCYMKSNIGLKWLTHFKQFISQYNQAFNGVTFPKINKLLLHWKHSLMVKSLTGELFPICSSNVVIVILFHLLTLKSRLISCFIWITVVLIQKYPDFLALCKMF